MAESSQARFGLTSVARVGVFAALAFGVNAPFLAIPNVETFSLALFLSGLFLGIVDGAAVALVAGVIFIFFNPNGPQTIIPVALAQMAGFFLFAVTGSLLRSTVLNSRPGWKITAFLAATGALLTFLYDLLTNFAFAATIGPFWPVLVGGISFGVLHLVSNTLIFGLSSVVIQRIWKRIEYLMPPLAG